MKLFGRWTIKQVAVTVLLVGLLTEGLAAAVFLKLKDFSLLDQGDTREYTNIADNLIDGHGYSGELEEPYRPTASRVPGMLMITLPFRYLFGDNDEIVTIMGKLILLMAALFIVPFARYFLEGDWPWLAAPVLIFIPAVAYYGINPYSTGAIYLTSTVALYASMVLVLRGQQKAGLLAVGLTSFVALFVRPASLFPLLTLILSCLFIGVLLKNRELRLKLWRISVAIAIGAGTIYCAWSYRNLVVFDAFRYSSVERFHLLHFTAAGMEQYLDDEGQAELFASLDRLPWYITRYHARDQLQVSDRQGEEGMRLLRKYPKEFVISQLVGAGQGFVGFSVDLLDRFGGEIATSAVAIVQDILTLIALIGIVRYWRTADVEHRVLIVLVTLAGFISILSGGVQGQPRFRFPLEPLVVVGLVLFFRDYVLARAARQAVEVS